LPTGYQCLPQTGVTISGRIFDAITNILISGATIIARNNLGNTITTITDGNGNYELGLLKAVPFELEIFAPGYTNKYVQGLQIT
jgi:hypothetical protein